MIKRLEKSIRAKLAAGFAAPFIVLVLFATIYYPLNQREGTLDAARNQAGVLNDMVALSVGTGLADSNYGLVKKTFNWATDDPNVQYVAILDEEGEVLFDHNPEGLSINEARLLQAEETVRNGDVLLSSRPIEYDGEGYGTVLMAYSLEEAMAQIWWNVVLAIVVNLLILGGGIGAVLWLSGRISGRIERLRDGAEAVSEGDLDVRVPVETEDELSHLAEKFNEMVVDIRSARKALEEEKESVEQRVEEATSELQEQKDVLARHTQELLGAIVSGERERAIGLPASAGWYMDPLAKHNRSWYIETGAASDNQAAVLFFW